jgi:hypothetical protein
MYLASAFNKVGDPSSSLGSSESERRIGRNLVLAERALHDRQKVSTRTERVAIRIIFMK